jgi:hypothetical protein
MIANGSFKFGFFEYDFEKDSTAGAVGQKNLGWHFEQKIQVLGFWIRTLVAPTSAGGLATLSFGWLQTAASPALTSPAAFMLPSLVGAFVPGFPVVGNILYTAPEEINFTSDVTMSVGVEALLTGRLQGTVMYVNTVI